MGAESPTTTIVAWTKKTPLSVGDDKVVSKVASSSSSSSSSSRHKASLLLLLRLLLLLLLLPIGQKNAHRFVGDSMRINSSSHIYTRLLFVCVREFDIYIYLMMMMMMLCCYYFAREEKPSRTNETREKSRRPHSEESRKSKARRGVEHFKSDHISHERERDKRCVLKTLNPNRREIQKKFCVL